MTKVRSIALLVSASACALAMTAPALAEGIRKPWSAWVPWTEFRAIADEVRAHPGLVKRFMALAQVHVPGKLDRGPALERVPNAADAG